MSSYSSMLPKLNDLVSDKSFYKELLNSECLSSDENTEHEENVYDFNEMEEVFSDHILMGKRLQRTLYRGHIQDLDEDTNHPPIALTDLVLKLFSKTVPNYGLDQLDMDYVSSVSKATRVSPCAMILALIYLERLQIKNSDFLESVSPSGLFVVTMLVASKFLFENEDDVVTNQIWSEALNIDVRELNQLEQVFLSAIDWRVFVDSSEYFQYLTNVEKMIAVKQSSLRGWLSYSDIRSILEDSVIRKALLSCIERIFKIYVASTISYSVTILSIYAVGCALNCKYTDSKTSKVSIPMKSDVLLQSSFPDSSTVGFQSVTEMLTSGPSDHESEMIIQNLQTLHDFSYTLQNFETLVFDAKRFTDSTNLQYSFMPVKVETNSYINNNSFHHRIINQMFHGLELLPISYKNTCIPISVT